MSVSTTCRDISELHSVAQTACRLFFQECAKAGIPIFITETYRSQARQAYLYEQGRTRPGPKVTWTLNSYHASRLAWDIAVAPPLNLYDTPTLTRAGAIARRLGITWGGDWKKNVDRPHFEVKTTWKVPAGYKFEGSTTIPVSSNQKLEWHAPVKAAAVPNKKEGIRMFKPSTATFKNEAIAMLDLAKEMKIISSDEHVKKVRNGEMPLDDMVALNAAVTRRYLEEVRTK